jgi:tRNA threonylcarbamoyladenosine biosynthesis protein TsaE
MMLKEKEFEITNLELLDWAANQILDFSSNNKVIAFYGEMGVGKTTLIKALCKKLGIIDNVCSPTYTIVNEYSAVAGEVVYHFDFYRMKNEQEAFDFGYEDYLYSGNFCFIEWPEKIEGLLPENIIKVFLINENATRIVKCKK